MNKRDRFFASAVTMVSGVAVFGALGAAGCSSGGGTTPAGTGAGGAAGSVGTGGAGGGGTAAVAPAGNPATGCAVAGDFALFVDVKVSWPANAAVAAGTGDLKEWWSVSRVAAQGGGASDTLNLCGLSFPDLPATAPLSGVWGVRIPDMTFEKNEITPVVTQAMLGAPGASQTYQSSVFAQTFGVSLANPTTDPWPTAMATPSQDTDQDMKPGVTVTAATGGAYVPFAAGLTGPSADRLYIAARQVLSLNGTTSDCSRYTGATTIATVGSASAVNIHVLGCRVANSATDCTADQASFIEGVVPVFQPAANNTFQMVRVSKAPSCADVRSLVGVQ